METCNATCHLNCLSFFISSTDDTLGLVHFRTLVTLRRVRVRVRLGLELRLGLVRVRIRVRVRLLLDLGLGLG